MNKDKDICDCNGVPVEVGSKVKVISVPDTLLNKIPENEVANLKSMIGKVFTVYEIDEWGGVWVEKWFGGDSDVPNYHSLSLDSNEMEVIESNENT